MLKILLSIFLILNQPYGAFSKSKLKNVKKRGPASVTTVKKPVKIDRLELMMRVYGSAKNRGAILGVLRRALTETDYRHILNKAKRYSVRIRESFEAKYDTAKRTLKIEGYDEPIYVSKNGKALRYKKNVFRFDKKGGVKATMRSVEKKLKSSDKKSSSILNLLIPKAHADEYGPDSMNSATLDIMLLLNYLEVYYNGDTDFFSVLANLAQTDPNVYNAILRLYNSNGSKRIVSMSCANEFRMDIVYSDGTTGVINWNGVQGSGARAEVTEGINDNWRPVQLYTQDEQTQVLNGQFFFCQMMNGTDPNAPSSIAVVNSLNEMIAPSHYGDLEGGDGYGDSDSFE